VTVTLIVTVTFLFRSAPGHSQRMTFATGHFPSITI
jgi:hypothetical protein